MEIIYESFDFEEGGCITWTVFGGETLVDVNVGYVLVLRRGWR